MSNLFECQLYIIYINIYCYIVPPKNNYVCIDYICLILTFSLQFFQNRVQWSSPVGGNSEHTLTIRGSDIAIDHTQRTNVSGDTLWSSSNDGSLHPAYQLSSTTDRQTVGLTMGHVSPVGRVQRLERPRTSCLQWRQSVTWGQHRSLLPMTSRLTFTTGFIMNCLSFLTLFDRFICLRLHMFILFFFSQRRLESQREVVKDIHL